VSAWDRMSPLQRKLEMKRRCRVRKHNRALRKQQLEAAAVEGVNHRPGAGLSRTVAG
jgi:hypothetical protein